MIIILSIIVISFLILIHELGHFLAARKSGMVVEEFGIGIPPKIWGKEFRGTVYSINWIPFGGFVRIKGDLDSSKKDDPDSFMNQPPIKKLFVVVAGILMNFLFGYLIFWGLLSIGSEIALNDANRHLAQSLKIGILEIAKNSPAEAVGLKPGDKVLGYRITGAESQSLSQQGFIDFSKAHAGQEIILSVEKKGDLIIVPRANPPQGEGPLGVAIAEVGFVRYPFLQGAWEALKHSFNVSMFMFQAIGDVFARIFSKGDVSQVAGPIGIVKMTASTLESGFSQTLNFMALISLNLAVFNLFPLPALDGGRLIFVLWELLTKRKVPEKYEGWIHSVGMIALLLLLAVVTFFDIKKLI